VRRGQRGLQDLTRFALEPREVLVLPAPGPAVVLIFPTGTNGWPHVRHVRSGMGSRRRAAFSRSRCRCRYAWFATTWQPRHNESRPSGEPRRTGNSSTGLTAPHLPQRFSAIRPTTFSAGRLNVGTRHWQSLDRTVPGPSTDSAGRTAASHGKQECALGYLGLGAEAALLSGSAGPVWPHEGRAHP
jgi:hypothetical protein